MATTNEEHANQIAREGWTIVEEAIAPELVDRLVSAIDQLHAELTVSPAANIFEGLHTLRVYNLLARGKVFEEVPVHDRVLPIIESVLDRGCLVSSLSSITILPGETAQGKPGQCHIGDEAKKQRDANIPVRAEAAQTIARIVRVEGHDLPRQLQRDQHDRRHEDQVRTCHEAGQKPQNNGRPIETTDPRRRVFPKVERGAFEPQIKIIGLVLVRVDRVVTHGPAYRADVKESCGPPKRTLDGAPANQRSPIEGQAQDDLRPIGKSLHERIDRNNRERGNPKFDGEEVELEQHDQSNAREHHRKTERLFGCDLARRNGPARRPGHLGVDIAIDIVVIGAA